MKNSGPIWTQARYYKNSIIDITVTIWFFSFLSYEWGKKGKHPLRILYPCVLPYLVSVPHATGLSLGTYRYVTSGQHNVIFKMLISCRYLKIPRFHIRIWNVNLSSKIKKWSNTEYTFTWEQAELSGNWPFPIEHEFWGVNTVPSCEKALASHVEKSCGKCPVLPDIPA